MALRSASTPPTFGEYRLLRPLGHGGMADVWAAERLAHGGAVALKRMRPQLGDDTTSIRMFVDEARLALRLRHPNIVRALDAGEVGGEPFLALELIDGVELRALWREAPEPLPVGFCLYVARELCAALAYAHALTDDEGRCLGVVHRDVSPSNVMLASDGAVKLLDFGVARRRREAGEIATRRGVIKGKIGYLAPEVLLGAPFDHRSDLFSVGVVLHELLTGAHLFAAPTETERFALNRACRVAPPSALRPEVPPLADEVTLRALAADPALRFQTADELMAALDAALAHRPFGRDDAGAIVREHLARTVLTVLPEEVLPAGAPPSLFTDVSAPATAPRRARGRRLRLLFWLGAPLLALAVCLLVGFSGAEPVIDPAPPRVELAESPVEPPRPRPPLPLPPPPPRLDVATSPAEPPAAEQLGRVRRRRTEGREPSRVELSRTRLVNPFAVRAP